MIIIISIYYDNRYYLKRINEPVTKICNRKNIKEIDGKIVVRKNDKVITLDGKLNLNITNTKSAKCY